jgi:hypothetical protein
MTGSGAAGDPDTAILRTMQVEAERLCKSGDALMIGQYEYLCARIRALIELRRAADLQAGA